MALSIGRPKPTVHGAVELAPAVLTLGRIGLSVLKSGSNPADADVTNTPPNEPEGRVVPFKRRGSLFAFNRARPSPVEDLDRFERTEGEDDYRHRMIMNAMALLITIVLIGGGIWIANSMALIRKNQDCVLSGKRNCNPPVEVPAAPRS
jgi:hypothetical protein